MGRPAERGSLLFRHRAWMPVAWGLALANLAGAWFAARAGEPWHASLHAVLAVAFALGAQRLHARRREAGQAGGPDAAAGSPMREELETRLGELAQLQRRLSEVEERLDFAERLLAAQRNAQRLGPSQG